MALFDDEDEQNDTPESSGWGVDESQEAATSDGTADDNSEPSPLAELDTATLSRGNPNGTLKRAVDREAGVVVYAYKNGNAGGLSTVPLSETDLVDDTE